MGRLARFIFFFTQSRIGGSDSNVVGIGAVGYMKL